MRTEGSSGRGWLTQGRLAGLIILLVLVIDQWIKIAVKTQMYMHEKIHGILCSKLFKINLGNSSGSTIFIYNFQKIGFCLSVSFKEPLHGSDLFILRHFRRILQDKIYTDLCCFISRWLGCLGLSLIILNVFYGCRLIYAYFLTLP